MTQLPLTGSSIASPTDAEGERAKTFTDLLRGAINSAQSGNPLQRVTVITPSYFSSFYLRRWLAPSGFINVEFMRIEDLADLLVRDSIETHGGRALTRLQGAELVREAVSQCVASGDITGRLATLAGQPSFLSALHNTLRQIEADNNNRRIRFDQLQDADAVTRAVGKTWHAYLRLKREQKLVDRTEVAAWAVEALEPGALETPAMQLSVGKVIVLAALLPAPQYSALWRTLVALPEVEVIPLTIGDTRSDTLLAEALDIEVSATSTAEPPIPQAVSTADTRSEVAEAVRRILAAAENGARFNQMAVFYGDPSYAARIRSALALANISVSGPPHEPFISSPAGRFITGLLKIAESDLERGEVGDWLATCPVQDPADQTPVSGVEWDRISRSARVHGGLDSWQRQLARHAKSRRFRAEQSDHFDGSDGDASPTTQTDTYLKEANSAEALSDFTETLAEDLQLPADDASWSDWTEWLQSLIDRYLYAPEDSATAESAERVGTVLERISDLDQLGLSKPDLPRFIAIVLRELAETRSGASNLGKGVFVADVRDAAATRFRHIHIVGMADGTFPSPDSADPLLPDSVRQQINDRFGTSLQLSGVRKNERRRQFLAALMSGDEATLSWSRSSGPGSGEAGPAQWLIEQVRRHPGNESLHAGDMLARPHLVAGLSLTEYGQQDTFSDGHEYELASVRRHVEQQHRNTKHWLQSDSSNGIAAALTLESGRHGNSLTEWSGDLSAASALVPAFGGEPLSASRVETFATCPLRYYFAYILKVESGPRETDSFHMAADLRGNFIHAILESYLTLRIADSKPRGQATLDEAMDVVTDDWQRNEPTARGRIWQLETGEIRRQLKRWLEAEQALEENGFAPTDAELSFGRKRATKLEQLLPPLKITLEDSTVLQFAGVIDRVDRHADGSYYVLDYKTGGTSRYTKLDDDPVNRGRNLQLALYSQAVQQFRSPDLQPVAGYWFVSDRKQRILPAEHEFDPVRAERRLHEVLESLQQTSKDGHFPPNPGIRRNDNFENCAFCDFERVCPASSRRASMLKAHSNDPRLQPYFDLAQPDGGGAQ